MFNMSACEGQSCHPPDEVIVSVTLYLTLTPTVGAPCQAPFLIIDFGTHFQDARVLVFLIPS
jgi:hypothetical protein